MSQLTTITSIAIRRNSYGLVYVLFYNNSVFNLMFSFHDLTLWYVEKEEFSFFLFSFKSSVILSLVQVVHWNTNTLLIHFIFNSNLDEDDQCFNYNLFFDSELCFTFTYNNLKVELNIFFYNRSGVKISL
jgi:hypothetical protein